MQNRLAILVLVLVAVVMAAGACTAAGPTPATAPPITAPPATTSTTAVTTTTAPDTTTTTLDRVAEIEAIFQDLEVRRLQALMDQDEEAFRSAHANDEYGERSMVLMDAVDVVDPAAVSFYVIEVFSDGPGCIAVRARVDMTSATRGGGFGGGVDHIIEPTADGWGYSWIGDSRHHMVSCQPSAHRFVE